MQNTTYTLANQGVGSGKSSITVLRDNCQPTLYCEADSMLCHKKSSIGEVCSLDRECLSVGHFIIIIECVDLDISLNRAPAQCQAIALFLMEVRTHFQCGN